jgi:hypothetical protein
VFVMRRLFKTAVTAVMCVAVGGSTESGVIALDRRPLLALPMALSIPQLVPADLIPIVRKKLAAIARRSPYGRYGKSDKDFVSAWGWSYAGRAAVRLYSLTHDPALIEGILTAWQRFDDAGHVYADLDGYGWYSHTRSTGWRYREAAIAGLIVQPIVALLLEAKRDPALASLLAPDRDRLLKTVLQGLKGLDSLTIEQDGANWVMNMSRRGPEPTNLMAEYAVPMLGLAELTDDPGYAQHFASLARTVKASWRTSPNGTLGWPYFATPTGLSSKPEPIHKSPGTIALVLAAYRAGIVFDADDLAAMADALDRTALVWRSADQLAIRWAMDGDAPLLPIDTPEARRRALQLSGWYAMSCLSPRIATTLDRLLPALDKDFTNNIYVMAGLTEHWLNQAQPARCAPRTRRVASK